MRDPEYFAALRVSGAAEDDQGRRSKVQNTATKQLAEVGWSGEECDALKKLVEVGWLDRNEVQLPAQPPATSPQPRPC